MSADSAGDEEKKLAEADWASQGLADLLDKANAPIFAIDMNGVVTEWNNQIGELTGLAKDSITGKPLADQVTEASQKVMMDGLAAAAKGEMGPPFELQLKKSKSKDVVKIHVGLSPQFGAKDQVVGVLCVGQAVPEPEQSPVLAADGAQALPGDETSAQKTKGMVMHELRSPLHGIIGLANTLSQDDTPLQKPLEMIGSSAERVLELVTNLMDYWNLSEDLSSDRVQDAIDITILVNESLVRCEQAKDKRGRPMKKPKVTVTKELGKTIPTVWGDQQAVSQMLYHLFLNAMKFTHQGSIKIAVEHNTSDDTIEVVVEDTGIGIAEANTKRVFEPFQQEDTSESRKYEGIGLGLTIVREVVRIHRGSVSLESTPGKGSRFTVSLPASALVARPEQDAAPASAARPRAARAAKPRSGPRAKPASWLGPRGLLAPPEPPARPKAAAKASAVPGPAPGAEAKGRPPAPPPRPSGGSIVIMSVDDDHVNQEVMRSVLEPQGYSTVICMSGTECLEYMEKDKTVMPDLILLDLMMPGINGFDVLQEQRKKFTAQHLPIIMVSAKNQASSVVKGLELGCNDWIHKPFDRQELIARVQTHLKWKDAMQRMQQLVALQGDAEPAAAQPLPVLAPQKPVSNFVPITTPVDTTVLFVTLLLNRGEADNEAMLTPLFEAFEILSEKHDAVRTEIIGSSYIAVARSIEEDTRHVDKMLQLALSMEEAISQVNRESNRHPSLLFKVGIHTDSHTPPIIDGRNGHTPRQYPASSFFCSTVRGAKLLVDANADGCILLSRSARCQISADIENEIQDRGLQMLGRAEGGEASAPGGYFCLTKAGAPEAAGAAPGPEAREAAAAPQGLSPGEAQSLRLELRSSQGQLDSAHSKLDASEQQLAGSRAEVNALRVRVDELMAMAPKDRAPPRPCAGAGLPQPPRAAPPPALPAAPPGEAAAPGSASPAASALFLQWQNAHLQAELRYYQEALALAKGQLQIQTMRSQSMEKLQGSLQERIEHLELDIGFKAACSGFLGPGMVGAGVTGGSALSAVGLPSGGNDGLGMDSAAAFCGAGFSMPSGLHDIGCSGGISPVQVGGGLLPGSGFAAGLGASAPGALLGGAVGTVPVAQLAAVGGAAGAAAAGAGQPPAAHTSMG